MLQPKTSNKQQSKLKPAGPTTTLIGPKRYSDKVKGKAKLEDYLAPEQSRLKKTSESATKATMIGAALGKIPFAETVYDIYNTGKALVDGDVMGLASNFIGSLLPNVSGKTIEAIAEEYLPKTTDLQKEQFKRALSGSPDEHNKYLKKYGAGYLSNAKFIKDIINPDMKQKTVRKYGKGTGTAGVTAPTIDPPIDPTTGLPLVIGGNPVTAGAYNTKPIVRYQPGVTDGATGDSGFYLYSRNTDAKGFNIANDREFVKDSNFLDIQQTPQWAQYSANQKKFANGTGTSGVNTKNYMQTPAEALADNDIMFAKAEADAADNPWAMGTLLGGQLLSSMAPGMAGMFNKEQVPMAAMGMGDAEGQIEAEGGEMIEAPGGEATELKGPKHTQGGIDLNVPDGTKIYSDQLKGADGKTMADRKKAREKKELKLDELLAANKGDKAIANSHTRMKMAIENEEQNDLQMQEMANQFNQMQEFAMGTGKQGVKMAGGTGPLGYSDIEQDEMTNSLNAFAQTQTPTQSNNFMNNFGAGAVGVLAGMEKDYQANGKMASLYTDEAGAEANAGMGMQFTPGDITGLLGNAVSMFSPMNNTLKNRASDTANINQYANYGDEALAANAEAKNMLAGENDNNKQRIVTQANGAKRNSRNSSRGVNTMRATDLAVDLQSNDSNASLSDQYARQMMAMLGQESNMKLNIDQVKQGGAASADLANRQDKDAFYKQLGQDKATMGQGLQQTGKDLNQVKQNETMMNMVNQMSKYFQFDKNNKIIAINKKTKK
jgi:hypothetical protein